MRQLRRFLGMVNFYRRFLPQTGETLALLTQLLSPNKGSRQEITWNPKAKQRFTNIKDKLANVTLFASPLRTHSPP